MRERRYWYVAAVLALLAGMVLGWRYPGVCPTVELHASGCPVGLDFAVGIISVGVALILAVVGRLRDPD